jgi:hypothetical protein
MEAVRTSETSVDNLFTRQYNPEDSSEHHTRRRENLKSHNSISVCLRYNRFNSANQIIPCYNINTTSLVRQAAFLKQRSEK